MADAQRQNWTATKYHASDAVSRSKLGEYIDSPGLYRDYYITRTRPRPPPSRQMELGTLVHLAVLEPDEWQAYRDNLGRRLVDKVEFTGKGARTREREWRATLPADAIVVTPKQRIDYESDPALVEEMARSIFEPTTPAARSARAIVEQSEREVTYTWLDTDPELRAGPMECRSRLDLIHVDRSAAYITDLKTTADPSPRAFQRTIGNFGYHWQAPFYGAPVFELTGLVPQFAFIAVRNAPPFEVAVHPMRPEDIAASEGQVRRALRRLSQSLATNTWCADWERRVTPIEVPAWALQEQSL